jgi:hypothetical protein
MELFLVCQHQLPLVEDDVTRGTFVLGHSQFFLVGKQIRASGEGHKTLITLPMTLITGGRSQCWLGI